VQEEDRKGGFSNMWSIRNLVLVFSFFALSLPVLAQAAGDARQPATQDTDQAQPANSDQKQEAPPAASSARPGRQTPCWRVAGISPQMVNQRWQIEDSAKTKIAGVCSDPALGPDQKLSKIHDIHKETDAEIAKLIPESQLTAFKQCQAQRDHEKAARPSRMPQKELGPCGGVIPSSSGMSHDHQMNKPSN
jgi:hypothetical protein